MKNLTSTYRLQLSPTFTFKDLEGIIDYLEQLGISTVYAAPMFQAREGSTHGYDVTNPFRINKAIGKLEDFRNIREGMRERNMTWLQDIVPNHMAFDSTNLWLKDIFDLGPVSKYYNFFDINWKYKGWEKVMAPFLGAPLEEILDRNEIKITLGPDGFSFNYYENKYPLSARSYPVILSEESKGWKSRFSEFSGEEGEWQDLKNSFVAEIDRNNDLKNRLIQNLEGINNSQDALKEILDLQYFIPAYWKRTEEEINYRRFFTINDLICLRMEDQKVFETYHYFIKELCEAGLVDGLRIDHIDGLFDPEGYLHKLRDLVGEEFYIVVEKILEAEENLPHHWPAQGTSGYEFLAQVNHLLTEASNGNAFQENYKKLTPGLQDYKDLVYDKKLFILQERMAGELHNLWLLLMESNLLPKESFRKEQDYKKALGAFLAAFPVYRIYPNSFPLTSMQKELVDEAMQKAREKQPDSGEELDKLDSIFKGEGDLDLERALYFLQRCQQFSGPLAAKGVEDTSFYIYNRLISHNEVGDSPENFGIPVEEFHKQMQERKKMLPLAINATATHDTKRGEDARMRLNVLSEIPQEWFKKVEEWRSINSHLKIDQNIPDANEEYFIYQVLLGGMSFEEEEDFLSRTNASLQKALREAKIHSNWGKPDEEYEQGIFDFVKNILEHKEFRNSFDPFFKEIAAYGAIKSLSQNLLKITAPGVPDIYQGTELWDLSYVDPDNRREVDYNLRKDFLADFGSYTTDNLEEKIDQLKAGYHSGKIKMYSMYTTLKERRNEPEIFLEGDYVPLKISGTNSNEVIGYARKKEHNWIIIIAPTLVTRLFNSKNLSLKSEDSVDLTLELPADAPKKWVNALTGETINSDGKLEISKILSQFPVALLKNKL